MELNLSYSLNDKDGRQIECAQAKAQIEDLRLCIYPKFKDAYLISLRDIAAVSKAAYKIELPLLWGQTIILSGLGYALDDFLKALRKSRNELIIKDMLMNETVKEKDIAAELTFYECGDLQIEKDPCEIRLYETGMVIVPLENEIVRIPYSDITEVLDENYSIRLQTEFEEVFVLSKMARKFDLFKKTLSSLMNDLSEKAQSALKEMMPSASSLAIRQAAVFLKEGRAAKKSDIESVLPQLYVDLVKKLETAGIKEEYMFLKEKADEDKIGIGIKRGLMGELTGDYIWFLIPIYSAKNRQAGNAVAIEAASIENKTSNATYFFRITSRAAYARLAESPDFPDSVDDFIKRLNRAMIAINFRREPIYLPDERLSDPRYEKYKFSIARMPELRKLRDHFIGRVFHRDHEKWCADVEDLLKFNVSCESDDAKWKYSETDSQEE